MIQKSNRLGHIYPYLSSLLPRHARPEDGVNQLGMSLLKSKSVDLLEDPKHEIHLYLFSCFR